MPRRTRQPFVTWASLPLAFWCSGCSGDSTPAGAAVGGAQSGAIAGGSPSAAGNPSVAGAGFSGSLGTGMGAPEAGGATATGGAAAAANAGMGGSASSDGGGGLPDPGNTAGAFSTDRARYFGASRCAAAGVQLCEDFESGSIDAATWKVEGDPPVVDSLQAARGSKALHIKRTGPGYSRIRETKTFAKTGGKYWGRAFFYFGALPKNDSLTYSHYTLIAGEGTGVAGEIRLGGVMRSRFGQPPRNYFGVGTDNRGQATGTGDWTNADDDPPGAPSTIPEKQWVCLEWLHDSTADQTRFLWDSVEHSSLDTTPQTFHGTKNTNLFYLPDFTSVWLGWDEYQSTSQTFELWIDEIAIDDKPIGCVR